MQILEKIQKENKPSIYTISERRSYKGWHISFASVYGRADIILLLKMVIIITSS